MITVVTDSPEEAASFIRSGETAAFPTETVYGLGADAFDERAVAKIFEAKGRPSDNPLIVHVSDVQQVRRVAAGVNREAQDLIDAFFPGPLTLVLPSRAELPSVVTAGLDTVGVRMPSHPIARAFLEGCAVPVAAPSANRSGRPSPTTWQAVLEDLNGRIGCLLKGGRSPVGLESTVVDCTSDPPVVLRAGAVDLDALHRIVPAILIDDTIEKGPARSPGTRHRHYAPNGRVEIVSRPPADPLPEASYIGLDRPPYDERYLLVEHPADLREYAFELFDFLRRCDIRGAAVVYCQSVPEDGLGRAIMDRLRRAADATAR